MLRILLVTLAAAFAGGAHAQAFPSKPMRTIVPFPPGSGLDIMARLVSQKTSESVGQPVIVENRPGANGMIGSDHVAKAAPDGYTVLATTTSTHVSAPFLVKKMNYDPRKDVTPITAAMEAWTVLGVNAGLPVNSVRELIDHLKKYPGKVAYGSPGVGNYFHLVGEVFESSQGVSLLHVPYKGVVIAVQAAATGEVQMAFSSVNNVVPHMKSGRMKTLAVLGPRRYPPLPDVPTSAQTMPGFVKPDSWFGFLGPAGLPAPILRRLNGEYVAALKSPEVRSKLESMGFVVIANSPEEFRKMYFAGFDIYDAIVKRAGIQPE